MRSLTHSCKPVGFTAQKLGPLCSKIGSGATPRGGSKVYLEQGEIALIRSQNVRNEHFDKTGLVFIEEKHAKQLANVTVEAGDVLLNITGDSVARCCQVVPTVLPARVNQHVAIIRPNSDELDARFLRYFLVSPEMQNHMLGWAAAGGTRNALTKEMIEAFEVPVPSMMEQRAIAHILGSLDDKIELNRRMNETLEAMAQALFKSWFIDFDPVIDNALAAGHPIPEELQARAALRESLGDARKPLPDDICNLFPSEFEFTEEIGWIPKGWKAVPAENALDINPRVQLKKNTTAPFVDMKALPTSGFSITEVSQKAYSGGAKFNNGDVLLARITPCLENGKTGIVDFLDGDETGFGSTEFIVLRGKGAVTTPYVACLSRLASFRDHCIQSMVGSSGRQRVQNACFSNFYLAVPPNNDLLKNFDLLVRGNFDRITEQTTQNRTLTQLRDNLLPKLLSGEIRIQAAEKLVEVAV